MTCQVASGSLDIASGFAPFYLCGDLGPGLCVPSGQVRLHDDDRRMTGAFLGQRTILPFKIGGVGGIRGAGLGLSYIRRFLCGSCYCRLVLRSATIAGAVVLLSAFVVFALLLSLPVRWLQGVLIPSPFRSLHVLANKPATRPLT